MKRKNEVAKTRDEKDAELLLAKLTNKAMRNLSEFWESNKQQFIYNNVAIKEAIKMSTDKNNQEMFNFFWKKLLEQGKDLSKDALFIKELVEIYIRIDNIKFIDCLLEHIGFYKLINQGNAFKIILDAKNKEIPQDKKLDMFKHLYRRVYEMNLPEMVKGIEVALAQEFDDAILFCLENEQNKPNTKLVKVWESAVNTLLERKNEDVAIKILECVGDRIPNFSYKSVYKCAIENNCHNVAKKCLSKIGNEKAMNLSKRKFVAKEKIEV